MKPTLNEEIEMSQKGIEYVDLLEAKNEEIHANAWLNVPQLPNHIFTKEQLINLGISNNLAEEMEKHKQDRLKRLDFEIKIAKKVYSVCLVLFIGLILYKIFID